MDFLELIKIYSHINDLKSPFHTCRLLKKKVCLNSKHPTEVEMNGVG